jgi:predicted branched-subunit amino acid permease
MPAPARLPYFIGFSVTLFVVAAIASATGFIVSDAMGPTLKLGLVFMNPVYFIIVLGGDIRSRMMGTALAFGAIAGPVAYLYTPQWSVLVAGLFGGTLAFMLTRPRGAS